MNGAVGEGYVLQPGEGRLIEDGVTVAWEGYAPRLGQSWSCRVLRSPPCMFAGAAIERLR